MIEIYTDASCRDNDVVTTCFCIDDNNFICHHIFCDSNISYPQLGELFGVVKAIEYTEKQLDLEKDTVYLYTDSEQILLSLQGYPDTYNDAAAQEFRTKYYNKLLQYISKYNINIVKVKAHQKKHNPNKVVDLISIKTLQNSIGGEG